MNIPHWTMARLYPITFNNTTTQFQFGFNLTTTSSDTIHIPMILDGMVDMSSATGGEPIPSESLQAYVGPTSVTPSSQTQTLNTDHTAVYSDITVSPIPYVETPNATGITAEIG